MTEHLDLDALADVLADGQEPAHLAGCADCRARLDDLRTAAADVSGQLAALEAPAMPAGLGGRLAAAIEQERSPGPTNVLPLQRRRTRWLPALGAVAAAAAVAVGAVVLVSNKDDSSSGTLADRAGGPGYAINNTGADYTSATLTAAVPGLLTGSAPQVAGAETLAAPAPTQGPTQGRTANDTFAPKSADPLADLRDTAGLARCLASITDPSESGLPLAVDYASYQGKPALIVVLPSSKPDKVDVFVLPPGCAQANGDLITFLRLPKP
jgi:hypothetical protein